MGWYIQTHSTNTEHLNLARESARYYTFGANKSIWEPVFPQVRYSRRLNQSSIPIQQKNMKVRRMRDSELSDKYYLINSVPLHYGFEGLGFGFWPRTS